MPIYDYRCSYCEHTEENLLAKVDETVLCPKCQKVMDRLACAPHIFTTIVPTTKTSKYNKAGYQHLKKNEPATKLQVGYGGGQSPENPKGGK